MGEVYKARDPRLNRMVAVKLLPAAAGNDAERRERFEREAQAVASLNQPGIVTIHSVEQDAGQFFLTMELVEGRSLTEAMPPDGWPLDRLLKIAITVADAMAAALLAAEAVLVGENEIEVLAVAQRPISDQAIDGHQIVGFDPEATVVPRFYRHILHRQRADRVERCARRLHARGNIFERCLVGGDLEIGKKLRFW
jgi:serine/threonine protein kinase